jgi:hypothetical protein
MELVMDGTDRLYQLYCRYFERHEDWIQQMNDALSSLDSAELRIKKLGRDEFIDRLKVDGRNAEIKRSWLSRIVRGHEDGQQLIQEVLAGLVKSAPIRKPHFLSKHSRRSAGDNQ